MRVSAGAALLAAAALAGAAAAAGPEPPARLAAHLDPAADVVVASTRVPTPERPVGEVRLVRRGDAAVVQTLLESKIMSRVVAEIRVKALAGWPEPPGRDAALRYVDALAGVQQRLWSALPEDPRADRRQRLWIEQVLAPDAAGIAIGSFERAPGDALRAASRSLEAWLEPDREWLRRDMRLIAADAFRVEGAALDALLAPLPLLGAEPARR